MMTKTPCRLPSLPKFDVAALVALQKANIETFVAAQKILFDLVQTVAKKQVEYDQGVDRQEPKRCSRASTPRRSRPPTPTS